MTSSMEFRETDDFIQTEESDVVWIFMKLWSSRKEQNKWTNVEGQPHECIHTAIESDDKW